MLFTSFKTLGLFALTFSAVSNAAPYPEVKDDFSLMQRRGNSPSKPQLAHCPTVEEAIKLSAIKSLPNALFWSGVSIPQVEALTKKSGRKQLRDLFPDDIRTQIQHLCAAEGKDEWVIMSEAMATIASGEAWVLKAADAPHDKYWDLEYQTMAKHRKVTALYRVNQQGVKEEQIHL
jgi:hypothetical protein